jgi:hypothetical protein
MTTKAGNHTVVYVGLTPTSVQRHETKSQARLISRPDRGRQPTDGGGPLSRCAYTKMWRGVGGTYDVVRCDLFPSPTSPSHRSLRRSGGGNPPHHFGSPALTVSGVVRPPRANARGSTSTSPTRTSTLAPTMWTSPLVRHVNPKILSVVSLLTFRPTRCRPSRSLSTNTSVTPTSASRARVRVSDLVRFSSRDP